MEHFYQNIGEDWFSYPDLYRSMVSRFDDAHFVEVGAWKGRSACYLGVEIINANKNIKVDAVDLFEYSDTQSDIPEKDYQSLYDEFIRNIEPVKSTVRPVKGFSHIVAQQYEDSSLDFVFIDGAHDYYNVRRDIISWYRKVKKGGVIAGHDYHTSEEVKRAVDEFFKGRDIVVSDNNYWYYNVS